MKKNNFILSVLIFVLILLVNTKIIADTGLMNRPWGEKAYALGQVGGVLTHDSADIYWNPAGLNALNMGAIGIGHRFWLDGYQDEYLSAGFKVNPYFSFGLGGYVSRNGKIEMFDSENNPLGSASFYQYLGIVGFGFSDKLLKIRNLNVGFNAKYNGISYDTEIWQQHIGVDLGVLYKIFLNAYVIEVGMLVQNLYEYDKWYSSSLPVNNSLNIDKSIILSAGIQLNPSSSFYIKYHSKVHTVDDLGLGFDYTPFNKKIHFIKQDKYVPLIIDIRFGGFFSDMVLAYEKISLGAGIRFSNFQINYTYKPNPVSTMHLLSLNIVIPPLVRYKVKPKKNKKEAIKKLNSSKEPSVDDSTKLMKNSKNTTNKLQTTQEDYEAPIKLGVDEKSRGDK